MSDRPILITGERGQLATALRAVPFGSGRIATFAGRDQLDLREVARIYERVVALRPALIINAAAYTAVDKAESDQDAAFALNSEAPAALARAAKHLDVPLIHVSTDYVFNGEKAGAYVEEDACAPLGVYGASKRAGEEAILSIWHRHVILRTSWVFAATGANFVRTMLRLGAERPLIGVVADQRGRPTYAADLAQAIGVIARALLEGGDHYGLFHVANAEPTTWADFAEAIFALEAAKGRRSAPEVKRIATKDYPTAARRPANSVLSTDKLNAVYGIDLRPWRQALAECLDLLAQTGARP